MGETRLTLDELRDDPQLKERLAEAAKRPMTPEEREEQRFSWLLGEMMLAHPEWTREEAVAAVAQHLNPRPYVYIGADGKATSGRALEDRALAAEAEIAALKHDIGRHLDALAATEEALASVTAERDALRRALEEANLDASGARITPASKAVTAPNGRTPACRSPNGCPNYSTSPTDGMTPRRSRPRCRRSPSG